MVRNTAIHTVRCLCRMCFERKGAPGGAQKTCDDAQEMDAGSFLKINGAGGRNRTGMGLPPRDFESRASTSFTTPAIFLKLT